MCFGKAEAGEAADLLEHALGDTALDAARDRALDEALAVGDYCCLGALAAHRAPQALRLAG